ncbi:hypothetical protein F7P73_02825 [Acinetobacter bohemicus]|uniref:Uncharacterized protein n=1 Tax=Acinetobacter bohemicus TaxID=1435036 RepID=A0A1I6UG67_9GAMM|nr:hypothetical protein [Acinetobacter bohemicus]KAB0654282.1 hypothetical protein F7P73_02825 [Acinetobacter bohemicus]SFT00430.1 hypothetical protein SAMN05444586_10164 [Acinetobacter bohemicus]
MALERLEALTSLQTTDGLVVAQKVVSSSINGSLETYYFSYLIDTRKRIIISDEVRSHLKSLEIEDIVIKTLEFSLTINSKNLDLYGLNT